MQTGETRFLLDSQREAQRVLAEAREQAAGLLYDAHETAVALLLSQQDEAARLLLEQQDEARLESIENMAERMGFPKVNGTRFSCSIVATPTLCLKPSVSRLSLSCPRRPKQRPYSAMRSNAPQQTC